MIKMDLCFFKILVIDIKEIREYQPLFVEFDEYTRFLFIMTMLRVFYISMIFLFFHIWQECYVHGKKIRVIKLTKRITYLFVLMQHSIIYLRDLFTFLIYSDYIFKFDINKNTIFILLDINEIRSNELFIFHSCLHIE